MNSAVLHRGINTITRFTVISFPCGCLSFLLWAAQMLPYKADWTFLMKLYLHVSFNHCLVVISVLQYILNSLQLKGKFVVLLKKII